MKKIISTLLFLIAFFAGYSQMYNNGGAVTVETGATLVIEGNYTSSGGATIQVNGNVQLKGDFINNGGDVAPTSSGTLSLNGTAAVQNIGGTNPTNFYCALEVNNALGVSLNGANEVLFNALTLTNGKLTLNAYDLTLAAVGVTGASSSRYILTNGTGRLIGSVPTSGSLLYPVGFDASNYAPVTLANSNVADVFAVQVKDNLLADCGSGTPITSDVVTMRWNIDPSAGTATEADVTLSWDAAQEGAGFDNSDCSVIHCNASQYDAVGGYGNGSTHTITGTNITGFSWFGVGDGAFGNVLASAKIFLQGAYNGSNMNTDLKTKGLLPVNQPYSNAIYTGTHLEYSGTQSNASLPSNTVDWVLIELRTGTSASTKVGTAAGLLLSDGSVVAYTGSGSVPFRGLNPGNYYVVLHHRNHLSVMSASAISLNRTSASTYNFSTALTQAYDNPLVPLNDQMVHLGSGVYGLWSGDVNFSNLTSYTGSGNDKNAVLNAVGLADPTLPVLNTYSPNDANLDGDIRYTGSGNDKNVVLNAVGLSDPTAQVATHLPN